MKKSLLIGCYILLLSAFSCTKGKAEIHGVVSHHDSIIPYATVYLQPGTNTFPGKDISKYSFSVQADGQGYYTLGGLDKGEHYVYAVGYDEHFGDSLYGGIPIVIPKYNSNTEVNVPITE